MFLIFLGGPFFTFTAGKAIAMMKFLQLDTTALLWGQAMEIKENLILC